MARETRRIGIRTAEVRLPGPSSFGPALLKTAGGLADREFEKQADIRTQEANIAAASLNFERDGDGNLMAPTVPIGENGLIAPSIYDRKYTQMVGQRYLQQTQIDVSERVNLIAAENPFDPEAFRVLAEGYVSKVTELAPDYLKPDVNNTAQIKMVEHYNHIVRVKAERDHAEARGLQLQTIDRHMDDLSGYVSGNADPEIIGAKMLEARLAIEQGDEFHFWLDDEKQTMLDSIDRRYAISSISSMITSLPQGDGEAYAEFRKALNSFAMGEGEFPMVNDVGEIVNVPLDEMPIGPDERIAIADYATGLLNAQEFAFDQVLDANLSRDWKDFFNWFSPHAMEALTTPGASIDMNRMLREYQKADSNVQNKGYKDTLREKIRDLMTQTVGGGGQPTAFQKAFLPGWVEFHAEVKAQEEILRDGRPREDFTQDELVDMYQAAVRHTGSIPGGYREQTKGGAAEVNEFYTALTGIQMDRPFYRDLVNDPNNPNWAKLEQLAPAQMARIGIWSDELRDTIIGGLMSPEGMNQETLDGTLRLARIFWENKTFRRNMQHSSALGNDIGRMLESTFNNSGRITAANLQKKLENFGDAYYAPNLTWKQLDPETKTQFKATAQTIIERNLEANWRTMWQQQGRGMAPEFDWNLFGDNISSIPGVLLERVYDKLADRAGDMDANNPDSFTPYIGNAVREVLQENGYGASEYGYAPNRFTNFNDTVWYKPKTYLDLQTVHSIVSNPPENFALDSKGNRDPLLMGYVTENFQDLLNYYANQENQTKRKGAKDVVYKAGINAALQYNPEASLASNNDGIHTPTWIIKIIADDGITVRNLTRNGLYEGDPETFNLNAARIFMQEDLVKEGKAGTVESGVRRTGVQAVRFLDLGH